MKFMHHNKTRILQMTSTKNRGGFNILDYQNNTILCKVYMFNVFPKNLLHTN